jgi:hypothetical protein
MEAVAFLNPGSEYDESTLVALRTTTGLFEARNRTSQGNYCYRASCLKIPSYDEPLARCVRPTDNPLLLLSHLRQLYPWATQLAAKLS